MKFYGKVGFAETKETSPGVWEEAVTERNYYGDVIRANRRFDGADKLNDDLNISNEFSIVCDPFALTHFHTLRFVEWMGVKWKVSNVDVEYPRLNLSVGGVYNEPQT